MIWELRKHQVRVALGGSEVYISLPACGGARIRQGESRAGWCPMLEGEPECLPCAPRETTEGLVVAAGDRSVRVSRNGAIGVYLRDEQKWFAPAPPDAQGGWTTLRFRLTAGERVYGLGQDPHARLDQNGRERRMWNQWGGAERSGNCGIGFFASTAGYGMLLNTPAAARFRFGMAEAPELDKLGEAMVPSPFPAAQLDEWGEVQSADGMDVFVLLGDEAEVIRQYHALTGLPKLPPKWAFGFLQCKNRYMNRDDLLATARLMRERGIPCDGLIIDWLWFKEFGDLTWNEADWRDAPGMLKELGDMGFHVSSAQHPFISERSWEYPRLLSKGYLNQVPEGKRVTYDHTNPEARARWWEKTAELYRQGLRGYWTDMGELEEQFDPTVSMAGDRALTHNAYSLMWAMGLYEGQKRDFGTRAFILSRSGCAGMQKYGAAMWSGDINASWQVLRDQVVIGQGMAMSGFPWWCTDIGGFLSGGECTAELYIRWMEWGVFCSLFRTHGTRPQNEAWGFGAGAEPVIRSVIELRYRLLPTLYSLAVACALTGKPMMLPMATAFPNDAQCPALVGQFMVGEQLLVAPVTERGARTKRVYLPEGIWLHYWSGKAYEGGWHTVPSPLGQIPFFVRGGSILPVFGRIGRNIANCGDLTAQVFPCGSGAFAYYDEDGETEAYLSGGYTEARLVNDNGDARVEALRGEPPAIRVIGYQAPAQPPFMLDADWRADEAVVTLTLLRDMRGELAITPDAGWQVTECSLERRMHEMYTAAYRSRWVGEWEGRAGDTVRWTLLHTSPLRRLAVQKAQVRFEHRDGESLSQTVQWDHATLNAPLLLGCAPEGAWTPEAVIGDDDLALPWRRDLRYARDAFGYIDLRRLDALRDGEMIHGEAWARENLFSRQPSQAIRLRLRHDSPISIWLNGQLVLESKRANARDVPLELTLRQGCNQLLIRQQTHVERPYSGGEFGYSLLLHGDAEVYELI